MRTMLVPHRTIDFDHPTISAEAVPGARSQEPEIHKHVI